MLSLLLAGVALLVVVPVGLAVHEFAHALVLRLGRVDHEVRFFPGRGDGPLGALRSCPWAVVEPAVTGRESPWVLRVAALAPLALCVPVFLAVAIGTAPIDRPVVTAAAIGWLACALPSPQDFSVAFYAHRVLDGETEPPVSVPPAD